MNFEIKTKLATLIESHADGKETRNSIDLPFSEYFIDDEKVSQALFEKVVALATPRTTIEQTISVNIG